MPPTDNNSWTEWRQHVLITLTALTEKMDSVSTDVAQLKVKAGIWGLLGGAIPVVIALVFLMVKGSI